MEESQWIFQRVNSMKKSIYKNGDLNGSYDVKIPLKSSAFINDKNGDNYSSIWSKLARLHPWEVGNPKRVSKYGQ